MKKTLYLPEDFNGNVPREYNEIIRTSDVDRPKVETEPEPGDEDGEFLDRNEISQTTLDELETTRGNNNLKARVDALEEILTGVDLSS